MLNCESEQAQRLQIAPAETGDFRMRGHRKRVLVTGGAGFLGSHLCDALVGKGYDVLCVDNFYTGTRDNISQLFNSPRFEVIRHDVTFPLYVEIDEIYNLACPASPDSLSVRSRGHDENERPRGYQHACWRSVPEARSCRPRPARSTEIPPCIRSPRPTGATSIRSDHAPAMTKESDARNVVLQLPPTEQGASEGRPHLQYLRSTHAPERWARGIDFIVQALKRDPITIYGDGSQTRAFCYVDDLIEGCLRFMEDTGPEQAGPINLGNPREFTMLELAESVIRMTGSTSQLEFRPLPIDDPKQRQPDISRAKQVLGWEPRWSLEEGLARTIAYFKAQAS